MRLQDFIADQTLLALDYLFVQAKEVPGDKLSWKAMGEGRTVLDQLQECASAPSSYNNIIRREPKEFIDTDHEMRRAAKVTWLTVEKCEAECRQRTAILLETIREIPDAALSESVMMPWGEEWKLSDVAMMHYWNMVYHTGQICFIQTLLGDKVVH